MCISLLFSFYQGLPGLRGEQGLPVSMIIVLLHEKCIQDVTLTVFAGSTRSKRRASRGVK